MSSFLGGTLGIVMASPHTEERTEIVFVYGTLTNPLIRGYACLCKTRMVPEKLSGYSKGNLTIFEAKNSSVEGGLIAVSKKELSRLDEFEGVPNKYRREKIKLPRGPVWVYIKQ